jgi:hypothetical protein
VTPFGAPGYPTNTATAPLAARSGQQDFSAPDRAGEEVLNRAIWKSVKGARSRMPAPRHTLATPPGTPQDTDDCVARAGRHPRLERAFRCG